MLNRERIKERESRRERKNTRNKPAETKIPTAAEAPAQAQEHTYFFRGFLTKKCYKLYSTIEPLLGFFFFSSGIIMYVCDLLYACIRNTSCSACQMNEDEDEGTNKNPYNHFKFAIVCGETTVSMAMHTISWWGKHTHNIQNTKYMKIVSYFFILYIRCVVVVVPCDGAYFMRPRTFISSASQARQYCWCDSELCVCVRICMFVCASKNHAFKKSTDQNGWNNIFDDMRIILATWAQITKISSNNNNRSKVAAAVVAVAVKWWTRCW